MKRLNLVLFGVFLLNFNVFAQIGGTTQRGKATHEMIYGGFAAAHSTFPLGSTIKVVNTKTGEGIDAVVNGRIPASPDRIVDLSYDLWVALGLTEGAVVMLVYAPPSVVRPTPAAAEPVVAESMEQKEMARLKATQPLYQLLILDRRNCEADSDISDLQNIELIFKFPHGEKGYLIVVYVSSNNGPVFPIMPDRSRIIVNFMTTDLAFLKEYTNTSAFKRFVTNRDAVSQLRKALK
jgi:hypothetical protein